ncbi:MAG: serine hydrolase domain-containing protein [Acidimicrobiales bacterium]
MTLNTDRLEAADAHVQNNYIDAGVLPGFAWSVVHDDEVVHTTTNKYDPDAIFRIYSMTKPITSVAMLMLLERGLCRLKDPVSYWLPEWTDLTVYTGGAADSMTSEPADRPITIQDLLTHTSGLTYGWMEVHPVDAEYRRRTIGDRDNSLATTCSLLADVPLKFMPGTEWQYSISTDVVGHLVELITETALDEFFSQEILGPLEMNDTAFWVGDDKADRLVPNTALPALSPFAIPENAPSAGIGDLVIVDDNKTGEYRSKPALLSGGGGLTSTLDDYVRFCRMILNGGELDGSRILGSRTLAYAGLNHLPGGATLADIGPPIGTETNNEGMGFGLGFSVVLDPAANGVNQSVGNLAWGGAASTLFWIDPKENLAVVGMTQVMPSWSNNLRDELRQLVYAAL